MTLSDIVPINRKEEFLQAIADKSGAPSPVTRIEEFLKRISETPGLPAVTSEDNGDFLGVVDGEWAKVPAPSSLPPYTSADKGKVLTVGEGSESETVVVVPEQTVTIGESPVVLSGADSSGFILGTTAHYEAVFRGELGDIEYEGDATCQEDDGVLFFTIPQCPGIALLNGEVVAAGGHAGDWTISLTASVPSVEPKWEERNIVIPVSEQFTSMFITRLTAEVPKAIQAGVGVPVYSPAVGVEAINETEWDTAVSLIEKSLNDGVLPVFYTSQTYLIGARGVEVSLDLNRWSIDGLSTSYVTNGYTLRIEFSFVLMVNTNLSNRKEVGLSTSVTLLDTP